MPDTPFGFRKSAAFISGTVHAKTRKFIIPFFKGSGRKNGFGGFQNFLNLNEAIK